jgi:hypothetical protein
MANADSRKFGVQFEGADNGALVGFTRPGPDNILYAANNTETGGGATHNPNLSNVKWHNGVDETRFNYIIAYTVVNASGVPQLITTEGIQTEVPPQASPLATSSENDTYLRFKGVADNAEFEDAIYQIKALNDAAGATYNDPLLPQGQATTTQVKTWADANLNLWTNFEVTTENTTARSEYFYATVASCDDLWEGLARSTQRLVNSQVYNVDTNSPYPPEAGEKVQVINNSASAGAHALQVADFNTTTCAPE